MGNSAPSWLDRVRVKFWPREQALKELRARIRSGELAWVLLLLENTGHDAVATVLDIRSWQGENTRSLKNATSIVRELLARLPAAALPRNANPEEITGAFQEAIRRSLPKPRLKAAAGH